MAKIHIGSRQSGKTMELIKRSCFTGETIIVATHVSVQYIKQRASELGLYIPEPITYYEFIDGSKWAENKTNKFLIDELQIFLDRLNIDEATLDKDSVSYLEKQNEK